MALAMATLARTVAALTLLIAAFVVGPGADAAACAPEIPSAHHAAEHPASGGDHSGKGADHGVCSHGHCHHSGSEKPASPDVAPVCANAALGHDLDRGDVVASHRTDGLKRPPRG
ncbi:hypothetical protein [Brevundimonas sp. UBA7534]|uniref:hypothetical protein n=1 Tax=Brevundimonas sp. UBA7534 TaxID=1946138 RepID=UPI0025BD596D|nr:hypothetical protein [Brevundimonas sp. UBA7534]